MEEQDPDGSLKGTRSLHCNRRMQRTGRAEGGKLGVFLSEGLLFSVLGSQGKIMLWGWGQGIGSRKKNMRGGPEMLEEEESLRMMGT